MVAFGLVNSSESALIKISFYGLIVTYILSIIRITKQEPNNLAIVEEYLVIRKSPYLWETKYKQDEVKGFSISTKSYFSDSISYKYPIYILYLTSGKKYHFIKYFFVDFKHMPKLLRNFGVKNLGEEKEEYKFMIFRDYKN